MIIIFFCFFFFSDTSPGSYYGGGNLSPMYPGPAGPRHSPQPTPIHSPQLPGGRTPSPADYQQQQQPHSQPPFRMVYSGYGQPYGASQPPASMSIPAMRSVPLHLAGGSCTAASNFTPVPQPQQDMVCSYDFTSLKC